MYNRGQKLVNTLFPLHGTKTEPKQNENKVLTNNY